MTSVDTLYEMSTELLDEARTALATTDAGDPERSFVSVALPSLDCCPQLTVHLTGLALESTEPTSPGSIIGQRSRTGQLDLVGFLITIVRCTPQPQGESFPSPEALSTVARQTQQDVWSIWNHLSYLIYDGQLWHGKCFSIYLDNATPLPENGACAGWTISLRAAVPGYRGGS